MGEQQGRRERRSGAWRGERGEIAKYNMEMQR